MWYHEGADGTPKCMKLSLKASMGFSQEWKEQIFYRGNVGNDRCIRIFAENLSVNFRKFEIWCLRPNFVFPNQRGRGEKRGDSFVGGKGRCTHMHTSMHKHPLLMLVRPRAPICASGAVSAHDAHANRAASGALSTHDTHVSGAVHPSAHQPATHMDQLQIGHRPVVGPFYSEKLRIIKLCI